MDRAAVSYVADSSQTNGSFLCDNLERDRRQHTQINPWPHNAMPHSFGSYFLGKTKDENLTASEMGNSPGMIVRHYRRPTLRKVELRRTLIPAKDSRLAAVFN
jgi:hypothetical protein